MKYQLINQDKVAELKDRDDALLNEGLTLVVAQGEINERIQFTAQLRAVGEIRAYYKMNGQDDEVLLRNGNFDSYFETNKEIAEAQDNGTLTIDSNNWYDIEFIVNSNWVEPSDQDVAYTISEGVELIKEFLADENFIKYLEGQA